ncbi:hypothetical protein [Streptomyces sp. NBC_00576]|uniref:hypothetical protein n=1 Tax=Streptomyces sp. NBC_00576 TaxID=2903665 RepID=UPI002E80A781|nr:hypothetical protein [Streptomyces sp. NBC_00576]WUB69724.1 hypothetical protein OG734_06375 [Streptomyces sp. NBC_00576]
MEAMPKGCSRRSHGALGGRTTGPRPGVRLKALRRHPVADVRDAALDEVTAYE